MALAYRAIISIVQLVFFVPAFGFGIVLALRHGFGKSSGWYFLMALSLLRTVGAVCEIIATKDYSVGVYTTAIICNSIGLAPLTLLCLGLLSRVNDSATKQLPAQIFKYISLVSLIGLVLGIVGGNLQDHSTSTSKLPPTDPESKAAIIIFVVVYLCTVTILCILSLRVSHVVKGEKRILLAVALCTPFIGTRLIYSIISGFAGLQSFSLISGNSTIYLCMAVIMEMIAVVIIIAFGLTLQIIPKGQKTDQESQKEMNGRSNEDPAGSMQSGQVPVRVNERTKAKGPISWLYYAGKDWHYSRQNQNS